MGEFDGVVETCDACVREGVRSGTRWAEAYAESTAVLQRKKAGTL